jgi:hypothetical protein
VRGAIRDDRPYRDSYAPKQSVNDVGQKSASGKFGASSPPLVAMKASYRLPQLLSLAVDFRE